MEGQDRSAAGWIGSILSNRWRIEAKIARGGVATVFRAEDLQARTPGTRVAIKIMHAQFARNPDARSRFLREGYAANKVGHRGVVRILKDDTTGDGSPFIVMELLEDGELLEERRLRLGGRLPYREVVLVCDQVLDVLIAAHDQGIIHRDIKPDNIFVLSTGEVKVLDFGIAHIKEAALAREPTATGLVLGTPEYMAPEQAQGKRGQIDAQTDIYAVGALMFTLVSGQAVHVEEVLSRLLVATSTRQARSLSSARVKDLPQGLITVIDKALALEKPRRWATARAMQTALRVAVPGASAIEPLPRDPVVDVRTTAPLKSRAPEPSPLGVGFTESPEVRTTPSAPPGPLPSAAGPVPSALPSTKPNAGAAIAIGGGRPILPATPPPSGRAWPPKPTSRAPIPLPSRASSIPPPMRKSNAPPPKQEADPTRSILPVTPRVDVSGLAAPPSSPTVVSPAREPITDVVDAPNTQREMRAPTSDTMMDTPRDGALPEFESEPAAISADVPTPRAEPSFLLDEATPSESPRSEDETVAGLREPVSGAPLSLTGESPRSVFTSAASASGRSPRLVTASGTARPERAADVELPPPVAPPDDAPTYPQAQAQLSPPSLQVPPSSPFSAPERSPELEEEVTLRKADSASSLSSLITSAPVLGPRTAPIHSLPVRQSSDPILTVSPLSLPPPPAPGYEPPPRASWEPQLTGAPARQPEPPRLRRTHVYVLVALACFSVVLVLGLLLGSCLLLRR